MTEATEAKPKYNFDSNFQMKCAALCLRDDHFARRTDGLIKAEYFESGVVSFVVDLGLTYFQRYKEIADETVLMNLIMSEFRRNPALKSTYGSEISTALRCLMTTNLVGANYIAEQVVSFAQYQELSAAIFESIELMEEAVKTGDSEKFQELKQKIDVASQVGLNDDLDGIDVFADIDTRTEHRKALNDGTIAPRGITTGIPRLDQLLKHKGWGRKEIVVVMGAMKSGKSALCLDFAQAAARASFNVLVVTLEVSAEIFTDRLDANITGTNMDDLESNHRQVKSKLEQVSRAAGVFKVHEYPTNSFKPSDLRRLMNRYKSNGLSFDLVVVDYADLMIPDVAGKEKRHDLNSIYGDLRAVGQIFDCAVITPTQTNREGMKQHVADMTNLSEDISKAALCDLLISINKTEEEAANSTARLYFAASRNQAGGFSIHIEQDLAKMKAVSRVVEIR